MRLLKWQNTDKGKDFIKQGIEQGAKQEREKNEARILKIEEFLRSNGVSEEIISASHAIK